jgi:hypothetical protein
MVPTSQAARPGKLSDHAAGIAARRPGRCPSPAAYSAPLGRVPASSRPPPCHRALARSTGLARDQRPFLGGPMTRPQRSRASRNPLQPRRSRFASWQRRGSRAGVPPGGFAYPRSIRSRTWRRVARSRRCCTEAVPGPGPRRRGCGPGVVVPRCPRRNGLAASKARLAAFSRPDHIRHDELRATATLAACRCAKQDLTGRYRGSRRSGAGRCHARRRPGAAWRR